MGSENRNRQTVNNPEVAIIADKMSSVVAEMEFKKVEQRIAELLNI